MRVAITGSNGYVGGAITNYLRSAGVSVVEMRRVKQAESVQPSVVPFVLGDSPSDERLRACDALIHCAYDLSAIRWSDIERINIQGSERLFQAAIAMGVKKIILISSISAFDGCASLYGSAKLAIERMAQTFNGVIVRPGLVYGDTPGGMMGTLGRLVKRLPVVPVIGGGQEMYLCHQDDLSQMIYRLVLSTSVPSSPVIACAEEPIQFRGILGFLAKRSDVSRFFVPVPWRLAWLGLKTSEMIGLRLGIKSDSLVSLMNPNPSPDFQGARETGVTFRELGGAGVPEPEGSCCNPAFKLR